MLRADLRDKEKSAEIALCLYQHQGSFYVKNKAEKTPITLMLESFKTAEDAQEVLTFINSLPLPPNANAIAEKIQQSMKALISEKRQKRFTPSFDDTQKESNDNNQNPDPDNNNNSNNRMFIS